MLEMEQFGFGCSHTTRARRNGEEDGVHYHFVSMEAMRDAIANKEFIEHAEVRERKTGGVTLGDIMFFLFNSLFSYRNDRQQMKVPKMTPTCVFSTAIWPGLVIAGNCRLNLLSKDNCRRDIAIHSRTSRRWCYDFPLPGSLLACIRFPDDFALSMDTI